MNWWKIRNRDAELEREILSDLELEEEEQRERGMPAEEARSAALRAFGNPALIREHTHEAWGWGPLERFGQDIRYAFRQLKRSPTFTLTSILILALGIGAVTAIFSLIDTALLKLLPVQNPEQLVEFKNINPDFPVDDVFSYPTFKALQHQTPALAGALAFRKPRNIDFEIDGHSDLAKGQLVSGNYFSLLGVRAIRGRTILLSDEGLPGQNPVAVIGYEYWKTRFALDPEIVGKRVLLNNVPFTIVGVTEPEFYGLQPGERVDLSAPLSMIGSVDPVYAAAGTPADTLKASFRNWLHIMGRLQDGMSTERATSILQPVFAQSMREAAASLAGLPVDSPSIRKSYLHSRLQLDSGSRGLASLRRQFSRPLWIVMAVVALLLLITCANVANLLLARANARQKEIAVRLALGGGRGRLIRQLLTESLLLAFGGGAIGVGLAYWGSHFLLALMARGRNPVSLDAHVDLSVLAFACGLSLLTALIFGTIPAWRATSVDPSQGLTQNRTHGGGAGTHSRLGKSLVILQVAISLVLVVGAGLLTRTLVNLKSFSPGFNQEHVLLFSINPYIIGYKDVVPLYQQLLERIQEIPGVNSATLSVREPLSTSASSTPVRVQGPAAHVGEDLVSFAIEPVGPDYFRTMQIPLIRGRDFSWNDRDGTPKVAVVNESMARHYFGDADPIGRFISIPGYRGDASWIQIVGEAWDIKFHNLREQPALILYQPVFQVPEGGATFEVRTATDPESAQTTILDAVKAINNRLPVYSIKTLNQQIDSSLVQERLVAVLSEMFGLLALLLTCIGLYGLMAYTVNRRTSEIGIRMALGAERGRIARMVLRETLFLIVCGIVLGLPGAVLASRLIVGQLFGLKPIDPITFSAACLVMIAVGVAASYLPARRAASVDPMQTLRTE